jgi:hypothetical protein
VSAHSCMAPKTFLIVIYKIFYVQNYLKMAPPNSFIHVSDYSSIEDLANYLLYLSSNPTEYFKYLGMNFC